MSNKKVTHIPPPKKKKLKFCVRIFQSAVGGRDGVWGLSNELPGGGNHCHTQGDRQRLNET